MKKIKKLITFLTIEQWKIIDEEYITYNRFDMKAFSVFITFTLIQVITIYFSNIHFFNSFAGPFIKSLPYPKLYPQLYWAFSTSAIYIIPPALIIKLVFKEKIRNYGFYFSRNHTVHLLYLLMFLVVIFCVLAVSFTSSFQSIYPFYKGAGNSLAEFFIWESAYGFQFFALEFLFRGFILFALARYIGAHAIFVMVVPYTMIHYTKPVLETLGAIMAGTALGTLALRTRSIYGGIILHATIAWSMDIFSLLHKGKLLPLFFSSLK